MKHIKEVAYIEAFNRYLETPPGHPDSAKHREELEMAKQEWDAVKQAK